MSEIYLVLLLPDWLREDFFSVKVVSFTGSVFAVKISDSSFTFSFDVRLLSGVFNMSLAASSKILIYQLASPQVYYPTSILNLNIQSLNFRCVLSGEEIQTVWIIRYDSYGISRLISGIFRIFGILGFPELT